MRIAGSTLLAVLGAGLVTIAGCASEAPAISENTTGDDVAHDDSAPDLDAPSMPAPSRVPRASGPALSVPANATPVPQAGTMSIGYHGGPVMLGTPDIYFIWYGNWSGSPALTILPDLMSNIGGSPYLKINTTYTDSQGRAVSGDVHYAGSITDNYSRGKVLAQTDVERVVASALSSGALPTSTNAIYFVITALDVTMNGFCNQFCGWHTNGSGSLLGTHIKYSFIGNAARCPQNCSPYSPSPNGDIASDGMASMIAHELEESLTDPELDAWIDTGSQENADKCAWKFGTTYTTASGAKANMKLGTRDYLIQTNLNRKTNKCELEMAAPPTPSTLAVSILSPAPSTVLHAGGPLDVVAQVTDNTTVTSAVVHWTTGTSTTDFNMTKNAAGNWELSTNMSTTAKAGTRSFTVTATDDTGHQVTSGSTTLVVQ